MDIYVDVMRFPKKSCRDCKFVFSTFSYGHDIYVCGNSPIVSLVNRRSVYWEVIVGKPSHDSEGVLSMVLYPDFEYIREMLLYCIAKGYIDEKHKEWAENYGR